MADDEKTDDLLPQWDWAIASSDDLVRYAGLMGVRGGPGYLIQPAPEGFQAQAEIIRRLMVATGEVFGLHRDNLDLDVGRLRVRRQLIDRVGFVEHTKSDHGQRTLDLDPETVGVLRRHLAAQAAVRLAVGPGYADQGLVFAAVDGGPLNPAKEAEKFGRRIARAGVPPIR